MPKPKYIFCLALFFVYLSWLSASAQTDYLHRAKETPFITLQATIHSGSAQDPLGQEGLAFITAQLLLQADTQHATYQQRQEQLSAMGTSIEVQVDKEMTTFRSRVHVDFYSEFAPIFTELLTAPKFHAKAFQIAKNKASNFTGQHLRYANHEELGKELLYESLYPNHPYQHPNSGYLSTQENIELEDAKNFYNNNLRNHHLTVLSSGTLNSTETSFLKQLADNWNQQGRNISKDYYPNSVYQGRDLLYIEKDEPSTAISFGYPIDMNRGRKDFTALLLANTYLGLHRGPGQLYTRMRELRGLNYGDYSYIEYFPQGMFRMKPNPNNARQHNIFQIWIRPVQEQHTHFAVRNAMFELDKLIKNGIPEEEFETIKSYLYNRIPQMVDKDSLWLGYKLDSHYYHLNHPRYQQDNYPETIEKIRQELRSLTRDQVHQVIQHHLTSDSMQLVLIGPNAQKWVDSIVQEAPSPIHYEVSVPESILKEDQQIERFPLNIEKRQTRIIPLDSIFTQPTSQL